MGDSDNSFSFVGKQHPTDGDAKRGKTSKGVVRYKCKATGVGPDSDVKSRTLTVYEGNSEGKQYDHMEWFLDAWDDAETLRFAGFTYEGEYEGKAYTSWNVTKVERWDGGSDSARPAESASPPARKDASPAASTGPATGSISAETTSTAQIAPTKGSPIQLATWAISTLLDNLDKFPEVPTEDKDARREWIKKSAVGLAKMAREVAHQL